MNLPNPPISSIEKRGAREAECQKKKAREIEMVHM